MDLKEFLFLFIVSAIFEKYAVSKPQCSKDSLSLLHIVVRHGNKTQEGTYPTDPYKNETYYPYGTGQLTKGGKILSYATGAYLREKYSNFLGPYYPEVIEAYSSPSTRCKISLSMITASLFPLKETEGWHDQLNWQPIPFNDNYTFSKKLFWPYVSCPNFFKSYNMYKRSSEYKKVMHPYRNTIKYLVENSNLTTYEYIFSNTVLLYGIFACQEEWGFPLPDWTNSVWPDKIMEIAGVEWTQVFATEELKTMGAGYLMSKIINDTYLTISNDRSVKGRKLYLYVGHDTNIYGILAWLDVLKPKIVQFGAYIILEIHNFRGTYYIQVLYQNYENATPVPVKVPKCGYCCPFEEFMELYSSRLHPEKICEKTASIKEEDS